MLVLATFAVAETVFGYHQSVDFKGWWPLILGTQIVVSALCCLAFAYASGPRVESIVYRIGWSYLLGITHFALVLYFYLHQIDWSAVNAGRIQLTTAERVLRSGWAFWGVYLPFLTVHALVARLRRQRHSP